MSKMAPVVSQIGATMTDIPPMVWNTSVGMTRIRAVMSEITAVMWNTCARVYDIRPRMFLLRL